MAESRDELNSRYSQVDRLIKALSHASVSGTLSIPGGHAALLESVVQTAADVIGARSAALFLIDEVAGDLVFEVALGPKGAEVKNLRVPLGHGIAGLVAVSGQAMAVSDIASDPRHAKDIASAVGYQPESILCVPLVTGDRIIGVLELLDKTDKPSFSQRDITTLGMFAGLAATAIDQSRTHRHLPSLVRELLQGSADASELDTGAISSLSDDPAYRASVELAAMVSDIVWRGESEREACRTLLKGFQTYLNREARLRNGGA